MSLEHTHPTNNPWLAELGEKENQQWYFTLEHAWGKKLNNQKCFILPDEAFLLVSLFTDAVKFNESVFALIIYS